MKFLYQDTPYEIRKAEITKLINKYPDRLPVYIQSSSNDIQIIKNKLLVDRNHTVGQFIYTVRSKLCLSSDKAIFVLDETGHMPTTSQLISDLYRNKKNSDGCLYIIVAIESTFGFDK